jgi:hypothetical protein
MRSVVPFTKKCVKKWESSMQAQHILSSSSSFCMLSYIFSCLKTYTFCLIVTNAVLVHIPTLHLDSFQQRNKSPKTYSITFWNSEHYSCLSSGSRFFLCIPLLSLPIQSFFILVNLSLLSCLKKNLKLGVTY